MTEQMRKLRRSWRALLERDGYPGPGPGSLALVMARAGVGKTAVLTGIGLDALLAGHRVLHVSVESNVDHVRDWYDDLLAELMRVQTGEYHPAQIQLEIERRRHIHSYLHHSFSLERLEQTVTLLDEQMDFRPQLIIFDRLQDELLHPEIVGGLQSIARRLGAELWTAARVHREGPPAREGHLPPPIDRIEQQLDLALRLEPEGSRVRLHVVKDRDKILDRDLHVLLDPTTLLLVSDAAAPTG
ncbi:MAG: hypothetical protein JSV80_01320 [Acidobacteriota bacterium]|nr:MAG: hypothetical protein JSV80_01320 [Acidobacteriota bacterium]